MYKSYKETTYFSLKLILCNYWERDSPEFSWIFKFFPVNEQEITCIQSFKMKFHIKKLILRSKEGHLPLSLKLNFSSSPWVEAGIISTQLRNLMYKFNANAKKQ